MNCSDKLICAIVGFPPDHPVQATLCCEVENSKQCIFWSDSANVINVLYAGQCHPSHAGYIDLKSTVCGYGDDVVSI